MSVTLEELVVKLEAENQKFMQQMVASQQVTQKSMDGIRQSINQMAEQGTKDTSMLETAFGTMAGFVGGSLVVGAFNVAKDAAKALFQTFIVDGIKASQEQIDAINRLNQSMAQTGIFSESASKDFQDFASSIQATTKIGDDAVLRTGALIQSLGQLDQQGLKRATAAAIDMSSALGIDLHAATLLVGKAATGETSSLGRYGLVIEKGATAAETFERVLSTVERRFGGSAQKEAQTFSGIMAQLNNNFGDLTEEAGFAVTQNVAVVDAMSAVSNILFDTTVQAGDNRQAMRELVGEGLVFVIDASVALIATLDAMMRTADAVFNGIQMVAYNSLLPVVQALNLVGLASDEMVETMKIGLEETAKGTIEAFSEDTKLGMVATKFAEVGLAAEEGLEKTRKGLVAIPDVTNKTVEKTVELTAAMKALIKEGESLANSYLEATTSSKAMAEEQLAQAEILRDMKMQQVAEEQENNVFSLDAMRARKEQEMEIELEFFEARRTALAEQQAAESEALNAWYAQNTSETEKYEAAKAGIRKKYDMEGRKLETEMGSFKRTMMENEVRDRQAQIGQLAGLQNSQNAYAKTVGKSFAVANTIMKMHEGAQAAYSAMAGIPFIGPALGVAAAAAVIADGTARISAIRGARGGITEVPGIGSSDTFGPVALAPGERVVPGETNQDLKKAIAMIMEGGGGGQPINIMIQVSPADGFMDMFEAKIVERQRLGNATVDLAVG